MKPYVASTRFVRPAFRHYPVTDVFPAGEVPALNTAAGYALISGKQIRKICMLICWIMPEVRVAD